MCEVILETKARKTNTTDATTAMVIEKGEAGGKGTMQK